MASKYFPVDTGDRASDLYQMQAANLGDLSHNATRYSYPTTENDSIILLDEPLNRSGSRDRTPQLNGHTSTLAPTRQRSSLEMNQISQPVSPLSQDSNDTEAETALPHPPLQTTHNATLAFTNPMKASKPIRPSTFRSWVLEIGAVLLSLASSCIIIVLLDWQDGKPISAWSFPTSLNTVISTLGTISRASMAFSISACIGQQKWNWLSIRRDRIKAFQLFDEASRGPWGSFRLLFLTKARSWASIGAIVTVVMLAFDPFLQAIIDLSGHLDASPTAGILPEGSRAILGKSDGLRLGKFGPSTGTTRVTNTSFGPVRTAVYGTTPDPGIVNSLLISLANSSTLAKQKLQFNCPTGNCTFPVFTSLAACSACNDISSHIATTTFNGTGADTGLVSSSFDETRGMVTKYALPEIHISGMGRMAPYLTASAFSDRMRTFTFQQIETLLVAFVSMRAGQTFIDGTAKWEDSRPIATECALYLCVNAYDSFSQSNILQESVVGSWAKRHPQSYHPRPDVLDTADAVNGTAEAREEYYRLSNQTLYQTGFHFTDLQLVIPDDQAGALGGNNIATAFNVTQGAAVSTISYILQWASDGVGFDDLSIYHEYDDPKAFLTPNAQMAETFYNATNLTAKFEGVSEGLAAYIRGISSPIQGTAQEWVILTEIQWRFITLPAVALILGYIYVFLTIWETARLKLPVWKEDAFITLAYGLDDTTQEALRQAERSNNAEKAAEQTVIRFHDDGRGLRIEDAKS